MSHSDNFEKEDIEKYLNFFAEEYKKNNNDLLRIIIVGGASVLLNYDFRKSTKDVDFSNPLSSSIEKTIRKTAENFKISNDWLNNNFRKSDSYSDKLDGVSIFYKNISDILEVRTINSEYLIAMKLVACRNYKHDLSDIVGILWENSKKNKPLQKKDIEKAIITLYGTIEKIPKESKKILDNLFDNNNNNYETIYLHYKQREEEGRRQLKKLEKNSLQNQVFTDHNDLVKRLDNLINKKFEEKDNLIFGKNNIDKIEEMACFKHEIKKEELVDHKGNKIKINKTEIISEEKNICKYECCNIKGKNIYILQQIKDNNIETWQFYKNFNKESAIYFIDYYNKKNKIIDNLNKLSNQNDNSNNGGSRKK
jgi:hypothetical protein